MRYQDNDRDRKGYAASVQWESPDESLTGTLEFIRSDATAAWEERYAGVPTNNNEWDPGIEPLAGTAFKTDANGYFVSGIIANNLEKMASINLQQWRCNLVIRRRITWLMILVHI